MGFANKKLAEEILEEALAIRASDIHIEPTVNNAQIRVRIDGILHELKQLSYTDYNILLTQFKVFSDMDIAEKRIPQDGNWTFMYQKKIIDVRLAIIPTIHGEKLTLRLLNREKTLLSLKELAFSAKNYYLYEKLCNLPNGLILVSGPTGSGKTTTLYATLQKLDCQKNNIITLEDPVEYKLAGINQVMINPKAGLTFAAGMRALVRQDPDIIMVGEIRDLETAKMAVQAALTGHLVFATLHANTAVDTITRLLDMGIEAYLLAAVLRGVVAQKLVRKLCPNCRKEYLANLLEKTYLDKNEKDEVILFQATGCKLCHNSGYYERLAIQEVLVIDKKISRMMLANDYTEKILQELNKENWQNIYCDGINKVLAGYTSITELQRVGISKGD